MTRDPVSEYLAADHERLDALLARAQAGDRAIDLTAYAEFRRGLLRHIGMEEKILLPAAQHARAGKPLLAAALLRLDHGALAALLVPTPTRTLLTAIRAILARHNRIEEGPGGVYETCARLAGAGLDELVARLRAAPQVPVNAPVDDDRGMSAARRALLRAGYDPAELGL
jgi:Hemerythrin HHE cation binding domain